MNTLGLVVCACRRLMDIYLQQNISVDHEKRATSLARELLATALLAIPRRSNEVKPWQFIYI